MRFTRTLTREERRADARQRFEIAVHEAGHAVAGVLNGGVIDRVELFRQAKGGDLGRTLVFDIPEGDPAVAYAGVWAQARLRAGNRRPTAQEIYAVQERTGCADMRAVQLSGRTGHRDIEPLLERCWPSILRLAVTLSAESTVGHDAVLDALGITDRSAARVTLHHIVRNRQEPRA